MKKIAVPLLLTLAVVGVFFSCAEMPPPVDSLSAARDPGVRGGAAGAGAPLAGLTKTELAFFNAGMGEIRGSREALTAWDRR
jgi:hypothetical protein